MTDAYWRSRHECSEGCPPEGHDDEPLEEEVLWDDCEEPWSWQHDLAERIADAWAHGQHVVLNVLR